MTLTVTVQRRWMDRHWTALDGSCYASKPSMQTTAKVEVEKRPRESRIRPTDLTTSLTNRSKQYIARTYYGIGRDVYQTTTTLVPCTGKPVMYTGDYPLTGAYIPIPSYPDGNWQLGIRRKIAEEQVSFAENIGEYRESVELLKGTSHILQRAGRTARSIWRNRKNRAKVVRILKRKLDGIVQPKTPREWQDIIGTDLAIKFGVIPYFGQLDDVLTQLNAVKQRKIRVITTTKVEASKTYTKSTMAGAAVSDGTKTQRAVIYVTFADTHGNFTAGNLGSSIWAGTPLSFMVDWVIDVGGYLESLTALNGVLKVYGTVTTKEQMRTVSDLRPPTRMLVERFTRSYRATDRIVVNSVPLPSRVRVRIPEWNFGKFVSSLEIFSSMQRR